MDEKKPITFRDVSIVLGTISFLGATISWGVAMMIGMTEIRGNVTLMNSNMAAVQKSVDALCTKYDTHNNEINNLKIDVATLKKEGEKK